MSASAPPYIWKRLIETLTDKRRPGFGQIATRGPGGHPEVRTVQWLYSGELDLFYFNTNAQTRKFRQLKAYPSAAGCLFDAHRELQFRWKGGVEWLHASTHPQYTAFLQEAWEQITPSLRAAYWKGYGRREPIGKRCPDSITVLCRPRWWDLYAPNADDYFKGKRFEARPMGGKWKLNRICPLRGR